MILTRRQLLKTALAATAGLLAVPFVPRTPPTATCAIMLEPTGTMFTSLAEVIDVAQYGDVLYVSGNVIETLALPLDSPLTIVGTRRQTVTGVTFERR